MSGDDSPDWELGDIATEPTRYCYLRQRAVIEGGKLVVVETVDSIPARDVDTTTEGD